MEETPNHKHFEVHIDSDDWMVVQNVKHVAFAIAFVVASFVSCYTVMNHDWSKYGYHSDRTFETSVNYNNR